MRWGIVGTGGMATTMAETILHMNDAIVTAVASRSDERAHRFAAAHGIPWAFSSVETLALCDDVDAVYVASANDRHHVDATECLLAGKPVLCEKPLTTGLEAAEMLVGTARSMDVFLMEAMWMRFAPFWRRLSDLIEADAVGPLRHVHADFGVMVDPNPVRRWYDYSQGGGALLDVGIYPVTLACLLAGEPEAIVHLDIEADSGVDVHNGIVLRHPAGVISVLAASFVAATGIEATISGPKGRIRLASPFHMAGRLTLEKTTGDVTEIEITHPAAGWQHEVEEVQRCVEAGLTESPHHPLADTLMVMRVLDTIRR